MIQYIYENTPASARRPGRHHHHLPLRSAVRDVGKALGLDPVFVDDLARSMAWWDRTADLARRFEEQGVAGHSRLAQLFYTLVQADTRLSPPPVPACGGLSSPAALYPPLVPVENASMIDRTVIQWTKEDIETLGLEGGHPRPGHVVGNQKKPAAGAPLLPRHQDRQRYPERGPGHLSHVAGGRYGGCIPDRVPSPDVHAAAAQTRVLYDLVIEIAIVRPGPIQGDMVHPYLRRKQGLEDIAYPSEAIKSVLERTLGVPIFQEQVIRLAMVAAGFSGGEADQLRRAITNWGRNSKLLSFEQKLTRGMIARGYDEDFARRLFEQIRALAATVSRSRTPPASPLLAYVSAWLKRHHPAAFCRPAQQPAHGVYSPSQLLQDARRHDVTVLPIDVNHSDWDHQLLEGRSPAGAAAHPPGAAAGERPQQGAQRGEARQQAPFRQVSNLRQRRSWTSATWKRWRMPMRWPRSAATATSPSGRSWRWSRPAPAAVGTGRARQLFSMTVQLPALGVAEEVLADYRATGLHLRAHPMSLLRDRPLRPLQTPVAADRHRWATTALCASPDWSPAASARQASGVLTLEDETGNSNIVVWQRTSSSFASH